MEKKTPLYDCHIAAGGKMVPFAGYLLPVQYSDVIAEHMSVREKAGLFDVSHMGEFVLEGPDALKNINNLLTNDFTNMVEGRVRYSPMCNETGGVIDDLIVYKLNADRYFLVVNAANREKDAQWIREHIKGDVRFEDLSDDYALLALQGPKSRDVLEKLTDANNIPEKYYSFKDNVKVGDVNCILSQTGYTGELGYELYCAPQDAQKLWEAVLLAGEAEGILPCGLGARDTLRLEAAMPLYGHEMDEDVSPLETGLSFAVKMGKDDFIGKEAILAKMPPAIQRIGLKVTGRGIVREHCPLYIGKTKIGETTSGTHCPYLGAAYAMALVDAKRTDIGTKVDAEVRGRKIEMEIVALPFYKRAK